MSGVFDGPTVTDILQAIFSGATLVVAVVASAVGLGQFREYRRTVREQSRPYVLVELHVRETLIMLSVRNSGSRPAANIAIRFIPELESTQANWAETIRAATTAENPIPVLAPAREIEWFFENGLTGVGNDSVPQDYEVELSYEDLVPRRILKRRGLRLIRVAERYVEGGHRLSLRPFNETALAPKGIPEIAQALSSIDRKMSRQSVNRPFGK